MSDQQDPKPGEASILHGAVSGALNNPIAEMAGISPFKPISMILLACAAGFVGRAGLGITNAMGAKFDLGEMIGRFMGIANDGPGLSGHTTPAASVTVPVVVAGAPKPPAAH